MATKILLLLLILFSFTCSGEKKSTYKELFVLKTLVDNARKPQPFTVCQDGMRTMELCAAMAPEFSLITLTEAIFASTLSRKKFTNYADYCSDTLANEPYTNQSDSLKECFLRCDMSYWQTRKNLNICNSTFNSMYTGSFNDNGTIFCKRSCLTPTNNNP